MEEFKVPLRDKQAGIRKWGDPKGEYIVYSPLCGYALIDGANSCQTIKDLGWKRPSESIGQNDR